MQLHKVDAGTCTADAYYQIHGGWKFMHGVEYVDRKFWPFSIGFCVHGPAHR